MGVPAPQTGLQIPESTKPTGPYVPTAGGPTQQQELGPGQQSMLLHDLEPSTDYEVTVSALLGRSVGSAASLTARTGERLGAVFRLLGQ